MSEDLYLGVFPSTTMVHWDGIEWVMVSESDISRALKITAWGATKKIEATADFPAPRLAITEPNRKGKTTRYYDPVEIRAYILKHGL